MTATQLDSVYLALLAARAALERIEMDQMSPPVHREVVNAKSEITTALRAVNALLGQADASSERPG
jgi:hypothetical protein